MNPGGCWRWFRRVVLLIIGLFVLISGSLLASFLAGRHSLTAQGQMRSYHLYVPDSSQPDQPRPLVLVFHMRQGFAWLMQEITGFNTLAARAGFIVAYPEAVGRSWADGSGRYGADQVGVDDVTFTAALIDELSAQYAIDSGRIYAVGFANGGFLALRLGCELADRLAAVAVVSATLAQAVQADCQPARALPVLLMHGTGDVDLPLDGLPGLAAIPATIMTWVQHNQCDPFPIVENLDRVADATTVRRETFISCRPGAEVQYYVIEDGGHRWPGHTSIWQFWLSGANTQDIDATEEIWTFLSRWG
jgi:polyhydroxybutyrate depolymerase